MITVKEFMDLIDLKKSKRHIYLNIENSHGRILQPSHENGLLSNFKDSNTYKDYKDSEIKALFIYDDPIILYNLNGEPILKTFVTLSI